MTKQARRNRTIGGVFIILLLGLMSFWLTSNQRKSAGPDIKQVMIGGEADLDACGIYAATTGVAPLLAMPDPDAEILATLDEGSTLWVCGEEAAWSAVVIEAEGQSCGVATPIAERQPYAGPCRQGWVATRLLSGLAG